MIKLKKFKNKSWIDKRFLFVFIVAFACVGLLTLIISRAAPALTIDTSLPQPQSVKAYGDDRVITVTWKGANNSRVVGYYITYRKKGTSDEYKVKQVQALRGQYGENDGATQLQPVDNNVEYEINVQSAAGTFQSFVTGSLDTADANNGGSGNRKSTFARADGKVSNKTTISATPSSARVDAQRARLTGFFDDFNLPAGPFDESKWNQAATACVAPGTAAAFINDQLHTHNMLRSDCDRSGLISRPRAIFDIAGATESNPAQIEFDLDGTSQPRDTWYLDIIPLSSNIDNLPVDLTSHNDLFDGDREGPGNMVRINSLIDHTRLTYYNASQTPSSLGSSGESTVCGGGGSFSYEQCDISRKTAGLSPLAEPSIDFIPTPNVRRHWVIQITPTKLRLYIDSALVSSVNLPSQFVAAGKFVLHSTMFSYNTGKQYIAPGENQAPGVGPTHYGAYPYIDMIHWDNFGFTGPAPTEKIYNYMEGSSSGTQPFYSKGNGTVSIPKGNRTTIIQVPDPIGTLINNKGRLFFTVQQFGYNYYEWSSSDHILFNGKKYSVPNPVTSNYKARTPISETYVARPFTILIDKADIKQGANTVQFVMSGKQSQADTLNVHLELAYPKNDTASPVYTQPKDVYGQKFMDIIRPAITNCDQYNFVEHDLGLPYESGKTNLTVGACALLAPTQHNHNPGSGTTTPPPASDTQKPTVSISSPTSGTSITQTSFTTTATASDNVGVAKVEFYIDGALRTTINSSPYTANVSTAGLSNGNHMLHVVAYDVANNNTQSGNVSFTFTAPAPPTPTSFETLPVGATLPTESECSARVKPVLENRLANATYNARKGTGGNYLYPKVTGNYNGTTDEIIQWGACKWGIDEDILRAQVVQESYWFQNAIGDFTASGSSCTPVYPVGNYPAQYSGDSAHNGQCPESIGLLQVRWDYHKSGFYQDQANNTLTNNAVFSSAYNVDYYGAVWRSCYEGNETWLNQFERGENYAAGDVWGCLGMWFSGRWKTAPALQYISNVQSNLSNRVWETTAFKNATTQNPIKAPGSDQSDTTAPTVSITAPTTSQTISGTITISANASDAVGVSSVSFYLDNSSTPFSTDNSSPFQAIWNSANVSNGSHSILARANDAAGNIGTSSTVTFNVDNVVQDTTAPTTSITSPANNATVNGTITISANASDNIGISKVELLIDGVVRATDTTSTYNFSWDTTIATNGAHTLRTKAYDAAGNSTLSSSRTVTVSNQAPPTAKPGDVNSDNSINVYDLSTLLYYWGKNDATRSEGDMNADGVVNIYDLSILLYNWGK